MSQGEPSLGPMNAWNRVGRVGSTRPRQDRMDTFQWKESGSPLYYDHPRSISQSRPAKEAGHCFFALRRGLCALVFASQKSAPTLALFSAYSPERVGCRLYGESGEIYSLSYRRKKTSTPFITVLARKVVFLTREASEKNSFFLPLVKKGGGR